MKYVKRQTVTAAIDATADPNVSPVAIRYINRQGDVRTMRVRKTQGKGGAHDASPTAKGNYMIRDKGLMRVLDLSTNQPKSIFIHAITGFSPTGEEPFYTVVHE